MVLTEQRNKNLKKKLVAETELTAYSEFLLNKRIRLVVILAVLAEACSCYL